MTPRIRSIPWHRSAHTRDDVFVGRIRRDLSAPNALSLWIVADNVRKGAATNAVQIAEHLPDNRLIRRSLPVGTEPCDGEAEGPLLLIGDHEAHGHDLSQGQCPRRH